MKCKTYTECILVQSALHSKLQDELHDDSYDISCTPRSLPIVSKCAGQVITIATVPILWKEILYFFSVSCYDSDIAIALPNSPVPHVLPSYTGSISSWHSYNKCNKHSEDG